MLKVACLGFVAVGFLACNTMTDENQEDSKTRALVAKDWHLTAWHYDPGLIISGELITDNYALLSPCVTDGKTRYAADGTFTEDEGPTKCEEENPQVTTGTWAFNSDRTLLTKTYADGSSQSYSIETLNDSALVISWLDTNLRYQETHKVILGYASH